MNTEDPLQALAELPVVPMDAHMGPYYVRLMVYDKPGVFADVAAILRDHEISMEAVLQRSRSTTEPVPVVLKTHEARESAVTDALAAIGKLATVSEPPHMIRIEQFGAG